MAVFVWTIDDPELVAAYAGMGVASITSNDPAMALEVVAG
jgi:glycerophosphoryl diester phosphodiesterase